jgi:hypothetical protein
MTMRILAALVCVSLVSVAISPVQGQMAKRFAGPLDSIQITSVPNETVSQRLQTAATTDRDLNTANPSESQIQLASIDRPMFENQDVMSQSVGRFQSFPPVNNPRASDGNPQTNTGLGGRTIFRVPEDAVNPQQAIIDSNQYIYGDTSRDGLAFGFDNSRLYHPLEGPQMRLVGAPTVPSRLGACDCCDEWDDFCRFRDLDFRCGCGGLKAMPGHLGLPWLGSGENCDRTAPRHRKGCRNCNKNKKGCGSCSKNGCGSCSD